MGKFSLTLLLVSFVLGATAQDKKWDVEKYKGTTKNFNIQTEEGTWMNLDVSPDGKEIVFDLLGDIYIMPMTGGKAKLLSGGSPATCNHVSVRMASISRLLVIKRRRQYLGDGTRRGNGKQVTKETFRLLNNAVWTPDSQYLIARKHFTGTRSLGAGEMWMYHIAVAKVSS